MRFLGQEKVAIGEKEEKPDCDSLERLLLVPRVGAKQTERRDCGRRPGTEAGKSG